MMPAPRKWPDPAAALFALALTVLPLCLPGTAATAQTPLTITARPIESFRGRAFGDVVQKLIWRGGLELKGPEDFGGLSGLAFIDTERFVIVSDRGQFFTGTLEMDRGRPRGLSAVAMSPIRNSHGAPLPPNYSRDAEAIDTIFRSGKASDVRVGFENLTRVADFELRNARPSGPAREVPIPHWLSDLRSNTSLESLCIAPETSPIAGATILLMEDFPDEEGNHSGWILGKSEDDPIAGPLSLTADPGFNPTDCAFLPGGDLLVLERGTGFLSFNMRIRRFDATGIHTGALLTGQVILTGSGGEIDNMEAMAVRTMPDGTVRITLMSDNNFNGWERNLLLDFELIEIQE
ncbi:MAG TPA: hypothetical protein ENJ68_05275 [Devosia sp.]|nr:hypothetical protein [Devosia sp.]